MRDFLFVQSCQALDNLHRLERGFIVGGSFLTGCRGRQLKDQEQWKELCKQAATEKDPDKLMELVAEISRLLKEKEDRLKANRARNDAAESP